MGRVEVKGNDEIALVATTFNSMAQSVSQYIKITIIMI